MEQGTRWYDSALCGQHPDPDLWDYKGSKFSDERKLNAMRAAEAISICNDCPVKARCLEEGSKEDNMDNRESAGSIWGGKTVSERAILNGESHTSRRVVIETNFNREVRFYSAKLYQ